MSNLFDFLWRMRFPQMVQGVGFVLLILINLAEGDKESVIYLLFALAFWVELLSWRS